MQIQRTAGNEDLESQANIKVLKWNIKQVKFDSFQLSFYWLDKSRPPLMTNHVKRRRETRAWCYVDKWSCEQSRKGMCKSSKAGFQDTWWADAFRTSFRISRGLPETFALSQVQTRRALGRVHTSARLNSLRLVSHWWAGSASGP